MKLGIDFGTTRTVVATADRGNYPVVSFFDEAGDAHDFFPSVVAERDGELRFGFDALTAAADPSFTIARSFKRLLSDPSAVPGAPARVGGTTLLVEELVFRYLSALRDALNERSNLRARREGASARSHRASREEPFRSVVAVPANAFGAQRFVTLDAFRRAGFGPTAMVNEPSAAGFEYTHRHRDTLTSKRDHVVVYDLGGGTFDASLVRMSGRRHEVLATAGVNQLGGDDFDDVMLALVLAKAKLARQDLSERAVGRLIAQCKDAKEGLSPSSRKITIDLESALEGDLDASGAKASEVVLSVAAFYEACGPLVARSIDAMIPVMSRLDGEAGKADVAADLPEHVAGVYVVGGASELPIVGRALRERFGRRVHRSPYPSAAIAIGLAIACDESAGFELADQYARTFGVFREGAAGGEITFDPIFAQGTPLPAGDAEPLRMRRGYRAAHNVGHFRFFECSGVAEDGRPRGDMTVSGDVLFPFEEGLGASDLDRVPVRRIVATEGGPRIEEEYALDAHGIVAITIRNLDGGYERVFRVNARS